MMKDGIGKVDFFADAINHDYESLCYSPSAVWHSQHHLRKVVPAGTPVFSLQSKTQPKNHIKKDDANILIWGLCSKSVKIKVLI